MSDYTPTMQVVRINYLRNWDAKPIETLAEFDRWLAQNNAEVAKATEERIIKLLETYALAECDDDWCSAVCECFGKFEAKEFIRLIKGEQE